jgi:outer membrane immunogenic protein
MKKLLIASAAALGLSASSAFAADMGMPYKAPPPPPSMSWTGCYVDGGVGYGMWNQDHYDEISIASGPWTATDETVTSGGRGWLGRLGGGCDYQLGGGLSNWVIGAFADYDFMHIHGGLQVGNVIPLDGDENERGAWYVGGRIGYLVTPKLLTYFDGGYTETRFDQINLDFDFATSPASGLALPAETYHGWFLGGGYEYALWDIVPIHGLFWRTEYRLSEYDAADLTGVFTSTGAPFCATSAVGTPFAAIVPVTACGGDHMHDYVQTITSGLVWRFNFGH